MIIKDPNLNIISLWIWFYIYKKAKKKIYFFLPNFFLFNLEWNNPFCSKSGNCIIHHETSNNSSQLAFYLSISCQEQSSLTMSPKSLLQKLYRLLLHTWQHLCLLSDHTFIRLVVVDFPIQNRPLREHSPLK